MTLIPKAWHWEQRAGVCLSGLVTLSVAAIIACVMLVKFSRPMPGYWDDAQDLVLNGRVSQHFVPSGYAALVAVGMGIGRGHPERGVEVEQAILQVLIVVVAWALMRRLGASVMGSTIGGVIVAVHPELLLSVTKLWDVGVSTIALLLVAYLAVRLLGDGRSWSVLALLGVALGAGCFDRPNYVLMLLPLGYVLWKIKRRLGISSAGFAMRGIALPVVAVAVYCLLSVVVYRGIVFPSNGPYNLYAGQNELSERALLDHLNAEPSLVPSLMAHGMGEAARSPRDRQWETYYRESSIEFARESPMRELRLVAVKLYTFLRADTKLHRVGSGQGMIKLLLTLPVFFWVGAMVWYLRGGKAGWSDADTLVCMIAMTYVIPFLITNSDPRFRTPLDIVLIAHGVALLTRTPKAAVRAVAIPENSSTRRRYSTSPEGA